MIIRAYAVKRKKLIKDDKTSTVGIATCLANIYLKKGSVVYGSTLNGHEVGFVRITDNQDLNRLRGSKYCQSALGETFKCILQDIKSDNKVFFCGTPCQVFALKKFLEAKNADLNKIILVDLVCHGVASPKIFSSWLEYCHKKNHSEIDEVLFRDKRYGWASQKWTIRYKNGKEETDAFQEQVFKNLYYGSYVLRPSCHSCRFTNKNRYGDITLGDFWNIREVDPTFYSENGVGLVFVNTLKGLEFFESCFDDYLVKEVDASICTQPQLEHPTKPNVDRAKFWNDFEKESFIKIANKYCGLSFLQRVTFALKNVMSRRNKHG